MIPYTFPRIIAERLCLLNVESIDGNILWSILLSIFSFSVLARYGFIKLSIESTISRDLLRFTKAREVVDRLNIFNGAVFFRNKRKFLVFRISLLIEGRTELQVRDSSSMLNFLPNSSLSVPTGIDWTFLDKVGGSTLSERRKAWRFSLNLFLNSFQSAFIKKTPVSIEPGA